MEKAKPEKKPHSRAESVLMETIRGITGCSPVEAKKAMNTLRRLKVIKFDASRGRYIPLHGMYMEADVLRNAIAY